MTETRPYHNSATQAERKAIVKNDSYFSRQQNSVDDAGGRFARLTPTNVTGSTSLPQVPQLPASSPWARFDQNVEPQLGIAVDEVPAEASIEPVPIPQVASSPTTTEVDRAGEPVVSAVSFVASQATGSIKRRRVW